MLICHLEVPERMGDLDHGLKQVMVVNHASVPSTLTPQPVPSSYSINDITFLPHHPPAYSPSIREVWILLYCSWKNYVPFAPRASSSPATCRCLSSTLVFFFFLTLSQFINILLAWIFCCCCYLAYQIVSLINPEMFLLLSHSFSFSSTKPKDMVGFYSLCF